MSKRSPSLCSRSNTRLAIILLVALSACAERALDQPGQPASDGTFDFDVGNFDASLPHDVDGGADGPICMHAHNRFTVGLTSVTTLDGGTTFAPTAALRLIVQFTIRPGCDVPADVTPKVTLGNATTSVTITAEVWGGSEACGSPITLTRQVTIPATMGANPTIVVHDGSSPTAAPILLLTGGSLTPTCSPAQIGDACDDDCDCNGADSEVLCLVGGDGSHHCGRACHEDGECRVAGSGSFCSGTPDYRCVEAQACRVPSECAFGEVVVNCRCTPRQPMGMSPPSCSCDDQCADGLLCGDGVCVQPCSGPHTCASFGAGEGGTACTNGACIQLI